MKFLEKSLFYVVFFLIVMIADDTMSMDCFSKNTELLDAVEQSDYEIVMTFVAATCDLKKISNEYGLDLLDVAVRNDDIKMVNILLENGFDINHVNWQGSVSLSSCQSLKMAELLVSSGIDVNYRDKDLLTPLHYLIISSKPEVVRFLVQSGAEVNVMNKNEFTPLMFATKMGPASLVKFLIDNGANINDRSNVYKSALHIAVLRGDLDVIKVLVEAGADINATDIRKETPLHLAATDGKAEIVKYLVEKGADVNRLNAQGNTPLWNAYNKRPYPGRVKNENRKEVIEILQKAGGI